MDTTKILKSSSGLAIGLGIITTVITILVLFLGIYMLGITENSALFKALSGNPEFSSLSERFAADGYSDVEGMRFVGAGACIIAVILLIMSLFNIFKGIIGFKLAGSGSCYIGAMVMGVIAIICDALTTVITLIGGGNFITKAIFLAFSLLYVYGAHIVHRETEERRMREAVSSLNSNSLSTDDEASRFFG